MNNQQMFFVRKYEILAKLNEMLCKAHRKARRLKRKINRLRVQRKSIMNLTFEEWQLITHTGTEMINKMREGAL